MNVAPENTLPEPDPELVEAMRSRVVRRKSQGYGNRKAGPGRPKGSAKTGGRKAGTPNIMSPEFRQWLAEKAKPFEILAAICTGKEIEDGDKKRRPTISERMRAAETIARKLLPDMSATALTGANGGPVTFMGEASGLSDFEFARRVAFTLAQGMYSAERAVTPRAKALQAPVIAPPLMPPATPAEEPVRDDMQVGGLVVSFAEDVGGRERWNIRNAEGTIVGSAFGRKAARQAAERLSTNQEARRE